VTNHDTVFIWQAGTVVINHACVWLSPDGGRNIDIGKLIFFNRSLKGLDTYNSHPTMHNPKAHWGYVIVG